MNIAIITIGEEILIGQIVDSNSAWMASELNKIGINVRQIISISDLSNDIKNTVNQLLEKYDFVISTGGLGPTSDDITKQALCELFNSVMATHQPTLAHIRSIFAQRGLPLTELNAKQAEVPVCCEVLFNPNGTAPGMWFERNGKILVAMPGVPFEMKAIMELHLLPRLKALSGNENIVHRTIHTFGLPESFLAERLTIWEKKLPKDIRLAYLPSPVSIRLRLTSSGVNKDLLEKNIQSQVEKLYEIVPNHIFGSENDTMASVVADLLIKTNSNLSLAESCTGGTIAHLITQLSGSSNFFMGGIVAYSNDIKVNQLGVDKKNIAKYGAVSKQVVEEMAHGVRIRFNSNYAIATSGIAGPTGATPGKPIGTVWVAISSDQQTISQMFSLGGDRERIILRSSISALNMLRLLIINDRKLQ